MRYVKRIGIYPLMINDKLVGYLKVNRSKNTYTYGIDLADVSTSRYLPPSVRSVLTNPSFQRNKRLVNSIINKWVEERVFPEDRQNIDELLSSMGLRQYDQFAILRGTNGQSSSDDLWIDFDHKAPKKMVMHDLRA